MKKDKRQTKKLEKITVESLSYKPSKKTKEILSNVSINLEEGNIYGILGPNGAGKTTLIQNILQLKKPSKGDIFFDKKNYKELSYKEMAKRTSYLPQNTVINADFTVREIIEMGRMPYISFFNGFTKEDEDIILEAMETTKILEIKDRDVRKLSGGEIQRVLIARSLVQKTPWIILDEPISSLDISYQLQIMELMKNLKEKNNKTIIAILHDINIALNYCDKIIMMKSGEIFAEGDTNKVITKENLKSVYNVDFEFVFKENVISYIKPIINIKG